MFHSSQEWFPNSISFSLSSFIFLPISILSTGAHPLYVGHPTWPSLLCVLHAALLLVYLSFCHYQAPLKGLQISIQCISKWAASTVQLTYELACTRVQMPLQPLPTRTLMPYTAFLRAILLQDICTAANGHSHQHSLTSTIWMAGKGCMPPLKGRCFYLGVIFSFQVSQLVSHVVWLAETIKEDRLPACNGSSVSDPLWSHMSCPSFSLCHALTHSGGWLELWGEPWHQGT